MALAHAELTPKQRAGIERLKSGATPCDAAAGQIKAVPGRFVPAMLCCGISLAALLIVALLVGSVDLSPTTVIEIIGHRICGDACVTPAWTRSQDLIVADTRLPRVLLAASCGAGLAMAGMVIQALVRNPLAGPGILGVSSGAATGAVLVLRFAVLGAAGALALNVAAFVGALVAMLVVFTAARSRGHTDPGRLILTGVAVSSILQAITSLLVITAPDQTLAGQVLQWTLGGFGGASWATLPVPLIATVVFLVAAMPLGRLLNLTLLGDDAAIALGLNIHRFRKVMIVAASLLVSLIVAVSGVISFVGLMLPHIARLIVGSDHRRALPLAALLGALFMVATDLIARRIVIPVELPVGIITALIGGPVFIVLIRHKAKRVA